MKPKGKVGLAVERPVHGLVGASVVVLLLSLAPAAVAGHDNPLRAGASGQCYDEDGSGGRFRAEANHTFHPITDPNQLRYELPKLTGATDPNSSDGGFLESGLTFARDGGACKRYDCTDDDVLNPANQKCFGRTARRDYFEVHAGWEHESGGGPPMWFQVCWDDLYSGKDKIRGSCDFEPNGPGA